MKWRSPSWGVDAEDGAAGTLRGIFKNTYGQGRLVDDDRFKRWKARPVHHTDKGVAGLRFGEGGELGGDGGAGEVEGCHAGGAVFQH